MSERLTIAVPRGALFGGTLDLLDRSGSTPPRCARTTASSCSRTSGIVTMRPSDVPTYVEHGSADIGITGKDVLLEQSSRKVYELLDLGYGRCEMVVAAPDGGDPIGRCAAPPRPGPHRHQVPAGGGGALRGDRAARPRSWR